MEELIQNYAVKLEIIKHNNIQDNVLKNIPIFIINLISNETRRQYIKSVMNDMKLNYTLVLVNKIEDSLYKRLDKTHILADKNKLGCILSHLYCIKKGIEIGQNKFIIFEDDIIFHKKFNDLFSLDLLNSNYDMLMLGACDFNYKHNGKNIVNSYSNNELLLYKPSKQALGAHANIYSLEFAKYIYNHKVNNTVVEFDTEFCNFYNTHNIFVCLPNLLVCELSTTNLNHNFGPSSTLMNNDYINRCFPQNFSYNDYNYITINLIDYIKKEKLIYNNEMTIEDIIDSYIKNSLLTVSKKQQVKEYFLNSGYTREKIKEILNVK